MMNFVVLTLSVTVGILLASSLSIAVLMNKKVLKWYMNKVQKITEEMIKAQFEDEDDLDEEETV